jgi:hypothetical protein
LIGSFSDNAVDSPTPIADRPKWLLVRTIFSFNILRRLLTKLHEEDLAFFCPTFDPSEPNFAPSGTRRGLRDDKYRYPKFGSSFHRRNFRSVTTPTTICRGVVIQHPTLIEIIGVVHAGMQDANRDTRRVKGLGALKVDPDTLSAPIGAQITQDSRFGQAIDGRCPDVAPDGQSPGPLAVDGG